MVQPPKSSANLQATLRFLGAMLALVLIFGACGSFFLAVFDKSQTFSKGSLFDPGVIFGNVTHFLQQTVYMSSRKARQSPGSPIATSISTVS